MPLFWLLITVEILFLDFIWVLYNKQTCNMELVDVRSVNFYGSSIMLCCSLGNISEHITETEFTTRKEGCSWTMLEAEAVTAQIVVTQWWVGNTMPMLYARELLAEMARGYMHSLWLLGHSTGPSKVADGGWFRMVFVVQGGEWVKLGQKGKCLSGSQSCWVLSPFPISCLSSNLLAIFFGRKSEKTLWWSDGLTKGIFTLFSGHLIKQPRPLHIALAPLMWLHTMDQSRIGLDCEAQF